MVNIGINNTATAVDAVYIGVENVAKRVIAAYVGIDGKAMVVAIAARLVFVTIENNFNTFHQQIMVTCDGNVYTSSFIALSGKPFTAEVIALQQFDAGTLNITSGRVKNGLVITATAPKPHYDTYLEFDMEMEAIPFTHVDVTGWEETGTKYRPVTIQPIVTTPSFNVSDFIFELTDIDSYGARGSLKLPGVYTKENIPSYFAMDIVIDGVSSSTALWSTFYEDFPESYIVGVAEKSSVNYTQSTAEIDIQPNGDLTAVDWFSSMSVRRESIIALLRQKIDTNPHFRIGFGFYEMQDGVEIDLRLNDIGLVSVTQEDKKFKATGFKAVIKKEVPFFIKTETITPFYQGLYTATPQDSRFMVTGSYEPLVLPKDAVNFVLPVNWSTAGNITYGEHHAQLTAIPNADDCVVARYGLNGYIFSSNLMVEHILNAKMEVKSGFNVAGATVNRAIFFSTSDPMGVFILDSYTADGTNITPNQSLWCEPHYDFYAVTFNNDVLRLGGYFYDCELDGSRLAAPIYKVDDNLTITHMEELHYSTYTTHSVPFANNTYLLHILENPADGNEYYIYSQNYTKTRLDCATYWPSLYRIPWRNGCVFDCGYDSVHSLPKMKFINDNLTLADLPYATHTSSGINTTSDYHIETANGTLSIADRGFAFLDLNGTRHVLTGEYTDLEAGIASSFPLVVDISKTQAETTPLPRTPFVPNGRHAVVQGRLSENYASEKVLVLLDLTNITDFTNWMQTNIV
jgi:hypothetical protein